MFRSNYRYSIILKNHKMESTAPSGSVRVSTGRHSGDAYAYQISSPRTGHSQAIGTLVSDILCNYHHQLRMKPVSTSQTDNGISRRSPRSRTARISRAFSALRDCHARVFLPTKAQSRPSGTWQLSPRHRNDTCISVGGAYTWEISWNQAGRFMPW